MRTLFLIVLPVGSFVRWFALDVRCRREDSVRLRNGVGVHTPAARKADVVLEKSMASMRKVCRVQAVVERWSWSLQLVEDGATLLAEVALLLSPAHVAHALLGSVPVALLSHRRRPRDCSALTGALQCNSRLA